MTLRRVSPGHRVVEGSCTVAMEDVHGAAADLSIPSFQRVGHIDFDDDRPVQTVKARRVHEDEDVDW